MTESDWLAADNPTPMFRHVRTRLSARKLQLLACGCCRLLAPWLSDGQRAGLAVVERYADGVAEHDEYKRVVDEFGRGANEVLLPLPAGGVPPHTVGAAVAQALIGVVSTPADLGLQRVMEWVVPAAAREAGAGAAITARKEMNRRLCQVFREVLGNPFGQPVVVGPDWTAAGGGTAWWMMKVGETARAIALGVQADQAFDRLPILADALEDDGCNDADLLAHFRHQPTHLRGCWALDLVLGKS